MTETFVVLSFYAYFALFLIVEFVITRSRLGGKEQGNKDRLSLLFFFICPFFGMVLWMAAISHKLVHASPSWPQWIAGYAIGLLGFAVRIIGKRTLGRFYTVRVQLYTVPGQVYYNASRKLILKGVDGIVFVADSQIDRFEANIESYMNMLDNLTEHDLAIEKIPFVMQYNKRDLARVVPVDDLERELKPRKAPYFEAVALRGTGVFDTLKVACKLVLKTLG